MIVGFVSSSLGANTSQLPALPSLPLSPSPQTQCVDPANYDMFGGEMAISYCWSFGQLPDQFAIRPFRVRMPNVTYYNIQRMPGGSWETK